MYWAVGGVAVAAADDGRAKAAAIRAAVIAAVDFHRDRVLRRN